MIEALETKIDLLNSSTMAFIENNIGKVVEIKSISGGLVHHVFKIKDIRNQFFYLKIRTSNTAIEFDGMSIKPDEMVFEKNAIEIMHNAEPNTFPKIIAEDSQNGIVLLSDIMPSGHPLIELLKKGLLDEVIVSNLASKIGDVHSKFRASDIHLRGESENQFFKNLLDFRYGYHNHPRINDLIYTLSNSPNGLIIGGLSPKNIVVRKDNSIGICDLETVCNGNQIFDVAFCLGHLMAHNISNFRKLNIFTGIFLEKYRLHSDLNIEDQDFIDLTLATILYRTRNTNVPYNIGLTSMDKEKVSNNIIKLINSRTHQWLEIIKQLNQSLYV